MLTMTSENSECSVLLMNATSALSAYAVPSALVILAATCRVVAFKSITSLLPTILNSIGPWATSHSGFISTCIFQLLLKAGTSKNWQVAHFKKRRKSFFGLPSLLVYVFYTGFLAYLLTF